jgi:hypothetical protein
MYEREGRLGGPPVGDLFQSFPARVLEESYTMAGVLEFMDVSPDFCSPGDLVDGKFTAGGATGVQVSRGFLFDLRTG